MTHTIYVIQNLSNPIIVGFDWLILIQAKLDFRSYVPSLQDDIGTAILNHEKRDLSNTLITDDFRILLHKTEQVINVRPWNARIKGRLLLIEALAYHNRT